MRQRSIILGILIGLVAVLAALALAPDRHGPHRPPQPPAGMMAMPRASDLGPEGDESFPGWVKDVMPMHRAVRLATDRFHGKVLDIALVPAPPGAATAHPLVYDIRILTRGRDVLDIRMDAFDGRFLDVRGADLGAARRPGKDD